MKTADRLIKIPEACHILGVGKSTLYELFIEERLRKIKVGRGTRLSENQCHALVETLKAA
jgi:excisionase family DNA binding protein